MFVRDSRILPVEESSTAVYTDIDGTVTAYNTIFGLLEFDANERGCAGDAKEFLAGLRLAAAQGVQRVATNSRYFTWWSGRPVAEVDSAGERWAAQQDLAPEHWPFVPEIASKLDHHAALGHRLVAVTASFKPALGHVMRRWPTLEVLCTEPLVHDGVYTGFVHEPLLGAAKASAVEAHAERFGIDLDASFGYGDHDSDLPFLALMGKPTLLGTEWASIAPGKAKGQRI